MEKSYGAPMSLDLQFLENSLDQDLKLRQSKTNIPRNLVVPVASVCSFVSTTRVYHRGQFVVVGDCMSFGLIGCDLFCPPPPSLPTWMGRKL